MARLDSLGTVTNRGFDGFFFVLCDAQLPFGGWDEHSEAMCDEEVQYEVGGQRACVIGSGDAGALHVFQDPQDGALYLTQPREGGVDVEQIDDAVQSTTTVGYIDVPSGALVVALAYPPLNKQTSGDFADAEHQDGEILRIERTGALRLELQHCASGVRYRVAPDPGSSA